MSSTRGRSTASYAVAMGLVLYGTFTANSIDFQYVALFLGFGSLEGAQDKVRTYFTQSETEG